MRKFSIMFMEKFKELIFGEGGQLFFTEGGRQLFLTEEGTVVLDRGGGSCS